MAVAYVDSVLKQGTGQAGSGNSAAKDTTVSSINFFALCRGILLGTSGSPTDSTGSNTWTRAVINTDGNGNLVEIWYVENPTTSGSHTFASTVNGYDAIAVGFYSGVGTSSFDQSNGNSGTSTSINTGSVTPGVNNELLIAATSENWNGSPLSADNSFTVRQYAVIQSGTSWAIGFADQVQTTATARDVTFSATLQIGNFLNACIATFKEATGGGGLVGPLIRGGMLTHGSLIRGGRLAA